VKLVHLVGFIINKSGLNVFSATVMAILTELYYRGYITKFYEPFHKCKVP